MTVAFDLKRPWPQRATRTGHGRYWPTLVTIWHVDPERDGSDDSCGWFPRARHGDPAVLVAIQDEFAFHWDADWGGWFTSAGLPRLSPLGITLGMFFQAARIVCRGRGDEHGWRRGRRFMRRHLFDILSFAENTTDSLHPFVTRRFDMPLTSTGPDPQREARIEEAAAIVYGCILRWRRPWYRHPRWHLHHWKIQIHPLQHFKRWAFSRCAGCGKRFTWGYAPTSYGWGGQGPRWFRGEPGVYHHDCRHPASECVASAKPV